MYIPEKYLVIILIVGIIFLIGLGKNTPPDKKGPFGGSLK